MEEIQYLNENLWPGMLGNFFVVLSQWQSSREEANGSTIRTILFPATSQGNDPTCCIGPANGIEVVVSDAGGVTAL